MRRLACGLALLVACASPNAADTLIVLPGPVATVSPGALLQLAVHVEPVAAASYTLTIDDASGALFDTKSITPVDGGAIISLVPACAATPGFVTFHLASESPDHALDLAIAIGAASLGACGGAPEHQITRTHLDIAQVSRDGTLCTRVTALEPSPYDPAREIVRLYGAPGTVAPAGHLSCDADSLQVELWPPIDAGPTEHVQIETLACRTDGCSPATSVSACCEAEPERTTPLTSQSIALPILSRAGLLAPGTPAPTSIACADLDGNGTPEIVASNGRAFVGDAGRHGAQNVTAMTGVIGIARRQADGTTIPTILGQDGTGTVRHAELAGGVIAWVDDPLLATLTTPGLATMTPLAASRAAGASYVAWASGAVVTFTCVSEACAGQPDPQVTISNTVLAIGAADIDLDGTNDLVVARAPSLAPAGSYQIETTAIALDWTGGTIASATPATIPLTIDLPKSTSLGGVHLSALPGATGTCDRIEITGGGVLVELASSTCLPADYVANVVSTVGQPLALGSVGPRMVVPTSLGLFSHGYDSSDEPVWQLQDPLLEEHALVADQTLVDNPTSTYGKLLAPCIPALPGAPPSVAFGTFKRALEWTTLDIPVQTFSAGAPP